MPNTPGVLAEALLDRYTYIESRFTYLILFSTRNIRTPLAHLEFGNSESCLGVGMGCVGLRQRIITTYT